MRIGRFSYNEQVFTGELSTDGIVYPLTGELYGQIKPVGDGYPLEDVKILAPCTPSKIICVGLNYRDHAEELNMHIPEEPVIFLKPSTSVIGPREAVVIPSQSNQVDFEGELAVVIKHRAKSVSPEEVSSLILGYTCANDVTARDIQQKDGQWSRAKSFDTFCPLGPYIVTDIDPSCLTISTYLNKVLKQHASTANMIFDIPRLISFISQVMTLFPGDVVLTGTPPGIGTMTDGDKVKVDIEDVGCLTNPVIE